MEKVGGGKNNGNLATSRKISLSCKRDKGPALNKLDKVLGRQISLFGFFSNDFNPYFSLKKIFKKLVKNIFFIVHDFFPTFH